MNYNKRRNIILIAIILAIIAVLLVVILTIIVYYLTKFLESKGYKVIRFWNNEIDNNLEGVYLELEKIFQELTE